MRYPFSILLVISFCIVIINPSFGQTEITDSIFLKNGDIITGKIKEYVPEEYLKIYTNDGLFFFQTKDLDKLSIHTNP